jgi:hypothetical protein
MRERYTEKERREKQDEPHPRATTCRSVPARPVVSPRSSPIAPGRRRQPITASLTRDNRRSRASHLQAGRPSPPRCAPASSLSPGRPAQLRLPPPPARRRRRHTGRRRQPTTAPSTRDAQQPPFPAPAQPHRTAASARRPTSLPNGAATASILHRVTPTSFLHARRHLLSPRLPPYVSPSALRPTSNRQRAAATYTPQRPFRADLATAPPPPSFLSPASKGSTAAEEAAIGEERRRWGLGSEARIGDVGRSRFSHLSGGTS